MRMSVTAKGIDWDRVKPEHRDGLAELVETAALECASKGAAEKVSGSTWYAVTVYHQTYTAADGREYCVDCARRMLEDQRRSPALMDALGTSVAARFGAHVREGVAA